MKRIKVAAGVVLDGHGKVLVGQRTVKDNYYKKWEFPGGKLEENETPAQALARELNEELGIEVAESWPLITIHHDYPDRKVTLYVREVLDYDGLAVGREGQAIQWVNLKDLNTLDFLQANEPIIKAAQMPDHMLITQLETFGEETTLDVIEKRLKEEQRFYLQIREPNMAVEHVRQFISILRSLDKQNHMTILFNGDIDVAITLPVDGVHIKASALSSLDQAAMNKLPKGFILGASCHTEDDIHIANQYADYAVLGSVLPTPSHPGGATIGWDMFESLVDKAALPVYAIGGMSWSDEMSARHKGAQGVAMISAAWGQ